jgi:hypothetical protein
VKTIFKLKKTIEKAEKPSLSILNIEKYVEQTSMDFVSSPKCTFFDLNAKKQVFP